jgi:hypothetical protein
MSTFRISVAVALVFAFAFVVLTSVQGPKISTAPIVVPEPVKSFCEGPQPAYTKMPDEQPLKRIPPAKLFAEFDAMAAEFQKAGVKTLNAKKTNDMIRQLVAFHGEPECQEAEPRMYMAQVMDRAVAFADADKAEVLRIANDSAGRTSFADQMERRFLSDGKDFNIRAIGEKATTLHIKWVLINRPFVYKVANEGDFLSNVKKRGFKTVVFTDGFNSSWKYDLTKM